MINWHCKLYMAVLNYVLLNLPLDIITGIDTWVWGLMAIVSHCPTSDAAVQAASLDCLCYPHPCDWEPCLSLLAPTIWMKAGLL